MKFLILNNNQKYKLKQIAVITLSWVLISNFIALDLYGYIEQYNINLIDQIHPFYFFLVNTVPPFIAGIVGGWILVFKIKEQTSGKSYLENIVNLILVFTAVYFFVTFIGAFLFVSFSKVSPDNFAGILQESIKGTLNQESFRSYFRWLIIISITNLLLQIDDKFGPGVLWSIITGRYQKPREETRIVMFLDIRDSTSLAEKLGGKAYHSFLKEFFKDITVPVLRHNGNIHQYVGDEVVLIWNQKDGLENANCIKCFFEIEEVIKSRANFYLENFGEVPQFKAGVHIGKVTVGEIGLIKRDISLSGDVLNTTSRIQNTCKEKGVKILASGTLVENLPKGIFDFVDLGPFLLKGKSRQLNLMTVRISG